MFARLAIPLGLLAGIVVATVAVALVVAIAPDAAPARSPAPPTPPGGTALPAGSGAPTATPSTGGPDGSPGTPVPSAGSGPFHVGEPAPPLRVPQLGGGTIDLAVLRGRPVWIEFMASWCPSCRDEFPLMNGYAARFADQGLVVLAIDVREDEGTVAALANQLGPVFPMGLDTDGSAASAWAVAGLPTHFFIDADGVVRDGAVGGIGPDVMASALEKIMPGVTVSP
jgi:thiol-disulfide isomerase/thioredoxin